MDNNCTFLEPSLEKQLKGHKNAITALYYSPNDHQIASSSLDNSVLLWDLRGTMRSYRFQGHDEAVMDVTFSPSGKYMASASRDKTVRLWVPTVTGSTGMFKAHSQTVRSVQFNHDGSKIITASDDKVVKLWATEKQKFIASYIGHKNWVRCARMSSDGSVIASCSDDKTTRLWSPDSGECIHTFKDQKGCGVHLAWHPSGCYIAVGTSHGNIKLYDVRTHNLVQYYSIHSDAVTQVAFHPSGSYILTASKDGKMKILDLLEGHPIFTLSGHTGAINAVNFSPGGDAFSSAGDDKLVFLWKTNFAELACESKENVAQNPAVPRSASQTSKQISSSSLRKQGTRIWYLCYHSTKYPVTTFTHTDDLDHSADASMRPTLQEPNANSTAIDCSLRTASCSTQQTLCNSVLGNSTKQSATKSCSEQQACQSKNLSEPQGCQSKNVLENQGCQSKSLLLQGCQSKNVSEQGCQSSDCLSNSVSHLSHIPRTPPTPTTFTIPSIMNKSIITEFCHEDLFGMIKLKDNDVCYTSGTIEWVGRKRSFPINSGFKILNESGRPANEPFMKKVKILDETFPCGIDKVKNCDCADVLPTVNAIVDHLNALHEAVDIVDLRLNTIEDAVVSKN